MFPPSHFRLGDPNATHSPCGTSADLRRMFGFWVTTLIVIAGLAIAFQVHGVEPVHQLVGDVGVVIDVDIARSGAAEVWRAAVRDVE
jgi:hypothetical protein